MEVKNVLGDWLGNETGAPPTVKPKVGIEAALAAFVQEHQGVDEQQVRKIVDTAIADRISVPKQINLPNAPTRTLSAHTHPVFEKALKLMNGSDGKGFAIALIGPAGCGKSFLAQQLAEALDCSFGTTHCSGGLTESQLLGWLLPINGGNFEYVWSAFAKGYAADNHVSLLDEADALDPNVGVIVNSAVANGHLHIPQRHLEPVVPRGKRSFIVSAMNTFGTGQDFIYQGRNALDGATMDRFYPLWMDYDRALESQIGSDTVCKWVWNLREKAAANKLRRVVSTRMIIKAQAACDAGLSLSDAKHDLLLGWTRDELSKVGEQA